MTPHRMATVCFRVLATLLSFYSLFVLVVFSRLAAAGAPVPVVPGILAFVASLILYVAAPLFGRLAVIGLGADDRIA